jgi:curved DNA-binding protein CbpA
MNMSRANQRNYYRILHVQPDAPLPIITSSYRTLMQKLKQHPDLGGEHANAALINEAYAVLTDPVKRAAYDQELTQTHTKPEASGRRPATQARAATSHDSAAPAPPHRQDHAYAQTVHGQCAFCKLPYEISHDTEADPICAACASPLLMTKALQSGPNSNRAEQRIAREQAIVFFTGWPQQPGRRAKIKDLSPHGMLIHADQPLTEGQIIKANGELLSTVARVVNCRPLPHEEPGVYGIGVEFITLLLRQGHGTFFSADA